MSKLTRRQLAGMIDHTNLKACASKEDMEALCKEAMELGCAMCAINSTQTALVHDLLKNSSVHTGAAISFPLGQTSLAVKLFEVQDAIDHGADEIDYVTNIGEVKNGNWDYIRKEMESITRLCHENSVLCKVIFENCYLNKEEIRTLAEIAAEVRPDFIKTSTGFGPSGAKAEDVRLMKETVKDAVKVKAAGGIRDLKTALEMIEAGAERIGTSSTVKILQEFENAAD